MVEKDYNKKYKKWIDGDTFALKITQDGPYKDRYFILIRYENLSWDESPFLTFRVKITNNNSVPLTKQELDKLEYVKISLTDYGDRFLPFNGLKTNEEIIREREKIKFYPDEYGNLDIYILEVHFKRTDKELIENLIYLGNFKLNPPKKEYIPFSNGNIGRLYILKNLDKELIECYENYNLKKLKAVYTIKRDIKDIKTFIPPSKEEIAKFVEEMGFDFEHERHTNNSITYVGNKTKKVLDKEA